MILKKELNVVFLRFIQDYGEIDGGIKIMCKQ